ncbi:MAG: AAA family ATPase [Stackebrandtia sp.]
MSTHTSRRRPGKLRGDIVEVLSQTGTPMTIDDVTTVVSAKASTSSGSVNRAVRQLIAAGTVTDVGGRPRRYRLTAPTGSGTVAPTAAPSPPSVVPVKRPGGGLYHPRRLADGVDVEVLRQLRDAGTTVLLYGPPGTGKTALAEAAHNDIVTVAGDGDSTVADLVGEYTQNPDGSFEFVYGPLVRAMREGRCLFIDDATLIPAPVLAVLYPAMDGRGEITVKAHKGETVTASPGFYTIAGHNPGVHGAVLSDALASRLSVHIEVTTCFDTAKQLGVPDTAIRIARFLNDALDKGEVAWAPQMRELIAYRDVASCLGATTALGNLVSTAPPADRDAVAHIVSTVAQVTAAPLRLGAQVPTTPTRKNA